VLNWPLTYREAHILIGGCVIPIVGGWLVDWAPDEPQPAAMHVKRRHVAGHHS
jgi:hypothetical protein